MNRLIHGMAMNRMVHGGADGSRTRDLLTASQAFSQLNYGPKTSFWFSNHVFDHPDYHRDILSTELRTHLCYGFFLIIFSMYNLLF
jgi:hypothetical protein